MTYKTPRVKPGQTVACLIRGEVEIDGLTEGVPVPWPYVEVTAEKRSYPLFGALVKAVKAESVNEVSRLWGVGRKQVYRWRRALGVPRFNAGTRALWVELASSRLSPEARKKGGLASREARRRTPERPF